MEKSKILFLSAFFVLLFSKGYCQEDYPESVKKQLAINRKNDTTDKIISNYAKQHNVNSVHAADYQKAYDEGLKFNHFYAPAWRLKGMPYLKSGLYELAFQYIDSCVKYDIFDGLSYRGWCKLYYTKDYAGALIDLKTLDALTPDYVDFPAGENILKLYGIAYKESGEKEKALTLFDSCINSTGKGFVEHDVYLYKATTLYELQRYEEAVSALDTTIQVSDSLLADAFYYKALCYEKLNKDKKEIRTLLEKSKELYKNRYYLYDYYIEFPNQISGYLIDSKINSLK